MASWKQAQQLIAIAGTFIYLTVQVLPVDSPQAAWSWCRVMAERLARLRRLIAHSPHVLLIPCALFIVMTGLGLYGVIQAHRDAIHQSRSTGVVEADSANQAFQLMLEKASLPIKQIVELVKVMPNKQALQEQWDVSAPSWWLGTIPGTVYIGMAPLGVFDYMYFTKEPAPLTMENSMGVDLLAFPYREPVLNVIREKKLAFDGPILTVPGISFCVIEFPIFLPNVSIDERWGHTFNISFCPPELCYDPVTRTKLWGFANLGIDVGWLISSSGPFNLLVRKGYKFQLWRPPIPGFFPDPIPVSTTADPLPEPDDVLVSRVPVFDQFWELHVWKDTWATTWILPLIAVVVSGALLVSALVFSTLYSWEEHRVLLHSLLPKETIDRMRHEGRWASAQDAEALKAVRRETPAEIMLRIIDDNLSDHIPSLTLLLAVREALQRSADVYRPTEKQMQERMNELDGMDDDVRKALTAQLMGQVPGGLRSGGSNTSGSGKWSGLETEDTPFQGSPSELAMKVGCIDSAIGVDVLDLEDFLSPHGNDRESTSMAAIKSVRFTEATNNKQGPSWFVRQLAACATIVKQRGLNEELGLVLSRWLLLAPAVATLLKPDAAPAALETQTSDVASQGEGQATTPGTAPKPEAGLGPAGLAAAPGVGTDVQASKEGPQTVLVVMPPLLTHLEQVLVSANDWSFDAFALDEASHGRPLSCLGFWLLHSTGLKSWARMSTKKLVAFLEAVEDGYLDNPYHNRRHAADVLQSVHVIMHQSGLMHEYADQLTTLGCYLAAIVHDYEHHGCTNDFLVNSSDELAVRYNDRSPMENHHLAASWSLLKTKEYNILSGLPKSDVSKLRKFVIDLVLATDMKQHFAIQGQFETLHRQTQDASPSHRGASRVESRRSVPSSSGSPALPAADADPVSWPKPLHEQDRMLSLQMMLKCADLGHIAAPLAVHLKWVSALEAEFFLQGDKEKELGIPISPLCDRSKEGVAKSQIGFFDFVVLPLFKSFSHRFPETNPMMKGVLCNLNYWKGGNQPSHDRKTGGSMTAHELDVLGKIRQA